MIHQMQENRLPTQVVAFALVLVASLIASFAVHSEPAPLQAADFITTVTDNALHVLRDTDSTPDQRRKNLELLFDRYFAMNRISRFVAGSYWGRMSRDQQIRFQRLFKVWVVGYYSSRMSRYVYVTLNVCGTTVLPNGDALVNTRIDGPSVDRPLSIAWRVKQYDGGPKIIDVIVEGISMALVQKADFNAVLSKDGIDGLLSSLDARVIAVSGPASGANGAQ